MLTLLLALAATDLTPDEAADWKGERVTVRLTVGDTGEGPKEALDAYARMSRPAAGSFLVRLPKTVAAAALKKLGVAALDDLVGAEVRVTGRVEWLDADGKLATIVVGDADQVEAVPHSAKVVSDGVSPRPAGGPRRDAAARGYTLTSEYRQITASGFTVLIHPEVIADRKVHAAVTEEIGRQLRDLSGYMPDGKLRRLREVRVWVEHRQKGAVSTAEFHGSASLLRELGSNPDKEGDIEVSRAGQFVEVCRREQPYGLLHEFAHAHHHHVLGKDHQGVKAAYRQAIDRGLYDAVKHVSGVRKRAFASTNDLEYFAELTEAYFGKNESYPFVRADLKRHDPVGHALMVEAWGEPKR
ncbi:MAG: hypothetical protein ACRC33_24160 [Gemmataceae bacterium]